VFSRSHAFCLRIFPIPFEIYRFRRCSHALAREPDSEEGIRYAARQVRGNRRTRRCLLDNLRSLRAISGISQFSCARKARIARVRLSLAETGQLELTSEERERVRAVLLRAIEARALQLQTVLADARADVGTLT
jgi:hypothetical protein